MLRHCLCPLYKVLPFRRRSNLLLPLLPSSRLSVQIHYTGFPVCIQRLSPFCLLPSSACCRRHRRKEMCIRDRLKLAEKRGEDPFLIVLDGIEDPHNLGAIIRTANIAGAHGVIIPKRRAVGLTATVAKTSAGALNYTPVAKVTNLVKTMEELKEKGIWFVCADMDGQSMYDMNLTGPIGLVVGNEGDGVSRLVKENCDFVASIPMKGEITSLNASVAGGVLAYEIVRQRLAK